MGGGGDYESDKFYEMADRLGLISGQDSMFVGAIPPYDVGYREKVRQDAIEQPLAIRRIDQGQIERRAVGVANPGSRVAASTGYAGENPSLRRSRTLPQTL